MGWNLTIHGYRSTFKDAALRAGQLSYELKIPIAFFSWPSAGTLLGYMSDEDQIMAAVPSIMAFIDQLATTVQTTGKRLHVIAHSMGNRGLIRALERLAATRRNSIAQIIYAAPDIHQVEFLQLVDVACSLGQRSTLYASKWDIPVQVSVALHKDPRAGYIPPVTVAHNVDTIDVTKYDLSLLGHGYCFELSEVLGDLFSVIHDESMPAAKRRHLNPAPGSKHWVME
jgi:esterase/lipase superfamily enzyme